jgi:hypothetical protein
VKTLFIALGALGLAGCTGLKPAGMFAKETPVTEQSQPMPPDAVSRSSPRPAPPSAFITPEEVDENPYAAASKLSAEVDADSKATSNLPVTVATSHIQGAVREP